MVRLAGIGRRGFIGGAVTLAAVYERAEADDGSLADAIRVLGREKSAAESYAQILITVAKNDTALYVRGIRLYADAKAEFDGLIAELKYELKAGLEPGGSSKFATALQDAARKRVAFTNFVADEVIAKQNGAKPGLPDVIQVVPELVKALTDAGLSIWRAYHDAGEARKSAILADLDQLKWLSFGDLAK